MSDVLLLGGYGVFGQRIARSLVKDGVSITLNGRHEWPAKQLQAGLLLDFPLASIEVAVFDVEQNFQAALGKIKPVVVINTCGPFQLKGVEVAQACVQQRVHYIDLADGMQFVNGISVLDESAKAAGVTVISGASTVPCLSSAVIEHVLPQFSTIDSLTYGITPGQKAPRGLATAESILTYLGRPLFQRDKNNKPRHGWQNLYRQRYPELGKRWMASCDIPDIQLFKEHYAIEHLHFSAGMESTALHLGMWFFSWWVRMGLPLPLLRYSRVLLKMSHLFDRWGSDAGGMHMIFQGQDAAGTAKTVKWFLIARQGDGPQIPSVPAALLAKRMVRGVFSQPGAMPCVGLITLQEYLDALSDFDVSTVELTQ